MTTIPMYPSTPRGRHILMKVYAHVNKVVFFIVVKIKYVSYYNFYISGCSILNNLEKPTLLAY